MFVLDCSMTMAWAFRDETTPGTLEALDLAARDAATLANLERITGDTAANVLRMALRDYATDLSREGVT